MALNAKPDNIQPKLFRISFVVMCLQFFSLVADSTKNWFLQFSCLKGVFDFPIGHVLLSYTPAIFARIGSKLLFGAALPFMPIPSPGRTTNCP
jgi:hypothetical protein